MKDTVVIKRSKLEKAYKKLRKAEKLIDEARAVLDDADTDDSD